MRKINYTLCTMLLIIVMISMSIHGKAQSAYRLTLDEVVALAQSDAPEALLASTLWKKNYWTFRSFQADFKPQIVAVAAVFPDYNRSFESVIQDDGSEIY